MHTPATIAYASILCLLAAWAPLGAADDFLAFPGKEGPGKGKHVVLIAGDDEYRSEEGLPMLGKILSQRHGFDCTVLFPAGADGVIKPADHGLLSNPAALDKADAIVMLIRFRDWNDDAMKRFEAAYLRGVPIIALRTSTHAFDTKREPWKKWTWNNGDGEWKGGFGKQVLGETWVAHHGAHAKEGCRGVIEAANKDHPVLRGVLDVFADSDVYTASPPADATVLMRGQVTDSLKPDSKPVAGAKNDPLQAIAWTRERTNESGKVNRILCTTMGAATDLKSDDLRRLVVNGVFWGLGLEVPAKADTAYVDPYAPSFYGFNTERKNFKVSELGLGKALADKDALPTYPQPVKAPAPAQPIKLPLRPKAGASVALIGNSLGERMVNAGHVETLLHQRFPAERLTVRNLCNPGDTAGFRPHSARASQWAFPGAEKFNEGLKTHFGKGHYPSPDEWLVEIKADIIIAFFGYNESFAGPAGLENFKAELAAFIDHSLSLAYNGATAPQLVLATPIAFEDRSDAYDLPKGVEENQRLAAYAKAMLEVAAAKGVGAIDLFAPTSAWFAKKGSKLTINGCHLSDAGYAQLAPVLIDGLFGKGSAASKASPTALREAVIDKDWFWVNDYRMLNGVHVWGQRYKPFGNTNYPEEIVKMREMTRLRDQRIWDLAAGKTGLPPVDDGTTTPLTPVASNFNRPIEFLDGTKAIEKITMREGFKIALFASEKEFPDLQKPVQMTFDNRGRLWVATTPIYPHYKPGGQRPNDKLLILEDTDGDGRADKQTVFADRLNLPIGFEIRPEGVYLSQEPHLCLLIDDDKDDRADRMEILLTGFDTHDTHHAIHAYCADPSGAFYMAEGRFLHSQVETSYGPQRMTDGGVWRFSPRSWRLERYSQADYNNPWGITFDRWEQSYISDASNGENYWALPLSAKIPHGQEIHKVGQFAPKRSRPTAGTEFVSSRHFPDELQGHFMINNCIGFLGTSLFSVWEDGSGFSGKHLGDLVTSSDPNFRPVDMEFAPDGSLYLVDWHNPLIGHMQHSIRDPNRDTEHGRIYRITHATRPLVKPTKVVGASIPELLEALKVYEYRTRYRARRELAAQPAAKVLPAVKKWAAALDAKGADYEHHLCEALWATWAQDQVDAGLLEQCLKATSHQARAAAVEVLRHARGKVANAGALLAKAANDPHPRVRLAAIVAASWYDNADGARAASEALRHPFDKWMAPVTEQVLRTTLADDLAALKDAGALADNPKALAFLDGKLKLADAPPPSEEEKRYGPTRKLDETAQKAYDLGRSIFMRDAHCMTCHQANGQGLPGIYPPLTSKEWIAGNDERLIKIALKGLWGPLEVDGKRFDPTKGVPPMMGFGPLLNDDEMAAVLTYVRQSFGNDADPIAPAAVQKVRKETEGKADFFLVEDLMKQHPIPGWEKWKQEEAE